MSLSVDKSSNCYDLVHNLLPKGIKHDMGIASSYLRALSLNNIFTKIARRKISLEWRNIYINLMGILFILFIAIVWYNATQFRLIIELLNHPNATWIILTAVSLLLLLPTFNILRNFRNLMVDLFKSYIKLYPTEIANEKKIFRNVIFAIILFIASLLVPPIIYLFGLNPRWNSISIALLIVLMLDLMRSGSLLDKMVKRNKGSFERYIRVYGRMKRRKFYP